MLFRYVIYEYIYAVLAVLSISAQIPIRSKLLEIGIFVSRYTCSLQPHTILIGCQSALSTFMTNFSIFFFCIWFNLLLLTNEGINFSVQIRSQFQIGIKHYFGVVNYNHDISVVIQTHSCSFILFLTHPLQASLRYRFPFPFLCRTSKIQVMRRSYKIL